MGSTTLDQIALSPANTTVILLCSLIFFVMWNYRIEYDNVAISYRKVVEER